MINYRSIADLNKVIIDHLYKIPRDIDLIVGIPRSGMLPANLIALYLNLPYVDIYSFEHGHTYSGGERLSKINDVKKILLVDDSIHSGRALLEAKRKLDGTEAKIVTCAVYATNQSKNTVDIFFETVAMPRVFQWNIFHHSILKKSCVDIDGVLCLDPSSDENDDGNNYIAFLKNATPFIIPTTQIHSLVSARLEKYRQETEMWLKAKGVQYSNLVLLNLPSKEERQRANCHAEFKAKEYINSDTVLFIESSASQAPQIAKLSQKPVFCVENQTMYISRRAEVAFTFSNILAQSGAIDILKKIARLLLPTKVYNLVKKTIKK